MTNVLEARMKSQCSSSSFLELPSYTSFEGEDGDEDEEMEEVDDT